MINITKTCSRCKEEKLFKFFNKFKQSKDGLESQCKSCRKIYNDKYVEKNREKINQYSREKYQNKSQEDKDRHYQNNKEKLKEYREKPEVQERNKKWHEENRSKPEVKEKANKYNRKRYKENIKVREKQKNLVKKYFENPENKEKRNKHIKQRRENDPQFKLRRNISVLINNKLNKNNKSYIKYLDCNLFQYKEYIEKHPQFKPEMNWDNWGKVWEIDHVIPISSFDLTNEEEQLKAFHYSNTQPLFKTTEIAESFGYKNYIGNRNKGYKIS